MNLTKSRTFSFTLLSLLLALIAAGCGTPKPKPVRWNLSITKNTPASIEVDVVGVNPSEKPYWMNSVKPDDYWKPNSTARKSARKITQTLQMGQPWVIAREDDIWNQWFSYGATELMIMANLPGAYDNGPFDQRRLFVSLDKNLWQAKGKTLQIEVQDQMIHVLTPQRPRD